MQLRRATNVIQRKPFIDVIAKEYKQLSMKIYGGGGETKRRVRNALFGTWLGHPFHPLIVTVPSGAWVVSEMLDLVGASSKSDGFDRAADVTAMIGMAGAVLAIASGSNDLRFTRGKVSRIGLIHALTNGTGVASMALSLMMRARGSRNAARALGTLGLALVGSGSYIGGELVYGEHVGVSHVSSADLPHEFEPVMPEHDLPDGELHRVTVQNSPIVLLRQGDQILALADTCSHMRGPLHQGSVDGTCVTCPWHGSRFSMETGKVVDGPATFPQPVFDVRVRDHQIEVRLSPTSE